MARAQAPRLVAITDLSRFPLLDVRARARALCALAAPGSVAVLLRDHAVNARERLLFGRELRQLTRDAEQELWVADRLDLALVLEADGAHLGEGSVAPTDARHLLGEHYRISSAWHTAPPTEPEIRSQLRAVDSLLFSPIVEARKGRAALGVGALSALAAELRALRSPPHVYALGGVSASTAADCLAAGAWGVAAIGAAWADDVVELVTALGIAR